MSGRMIDITGREDELQPEGVIELEPYLAAVAGSDLKRVNLLSDTAPSIVYRTEDGRFDHVLYPCDRANVYLVIVVQLRPDDVYGHYLLDLNKEYGLDTPPS
jgi:hypothetical protein